MSSRSIPYSPDTENQVLEPWPIRTPPLSLSFTDLSTPSPVQYLENLVEAELYTWSSTFGRYCSHPSDMEPSWRDDASSSSHSYHGLHRRGPSELEGNVVWETSRLNGELGLAPEQGEGNKHLGLALNPSVANARTNTNTYTHGKSTGTGALPLPIAVWAKVMDSSKGRDKVLKCVQYTLRTYLYLLNLIAAVRPLSTWFKSNSKRMRMATSSLSLTRKCLLLLNPLHPLTHLLSPTPASAPTIIRHLIDLSSALSDDVFTLSRLGIVSRRKGRLADRWANRLWLLTTLLGMWTIYTGTIPSLRRRQSRLVELGTEEAKVAKAERKDVRWTAYKLWADLVFVSYEVFDLSWFKEPVQCAAGLVAAGVSTSKLYDQHWAASIPKA